MKRWLAKRHGGEQADELHIHRWRRPRVRSKKIIFGLSVIAFFVAAAVFGPLIDRTNPSALTADILGGPTSAHPLGTTESGQDVLAQLIDGTGVSLIVGFGAAAIATALALVVGLASGYLGGLWDDVLSVATNIFLVIPALPLAIVVADYLPNKGFVPVMVVIAATGWAWGARVLRAQTLSIRRRDYVEAARAVGERTPRILFAEILPNELAIVASSFLFTVIFAILTQAGLAFLGLANVTQWSWGTILYWSQNAGALQLGAWWWFVPPGLCIALLGASLAFVNFGIDEFINPRLRVAGVGTRAASRAARRGPRGPAPPVTAAAAMTPAEIAFTPVAREGSSDDRAL